MLSDAGAVCSLLVLGVRLLLLMVKAEAGLVLAAVLCSGLTLHLHGFAAGCEPEALFRDSVIFFAVLCVYISRTA